MTRQRLSGGWFCVRCGARFTAYAPAERHADVDHGGGRIGWVEP